MDSPLRAIIYSRVSTDAQERDGASLDTQERAGADHAKAQGWTVVRAIRDAAPGFTLERPGLAELRRLFPETDVVIAYAVDRLSRNQNHIGVLFDEAQRHGVRLEFVTERFEGTAVGRFIISARAFIAEVEREKIAERTMRGKRHHAQNGRYIGRVPYGYVRDGDGLAVREDQAAVVRRIFALFLDANLGMRRIAAMLNAERVPTRTGAPWHSQTVRWILSAESYTGVMRWSDVRHEDRFPAIIERATWEAAQARRQRKGRGQTQTSAYLLTGVLYCGACGARMNGKQSHPTGANGARYHYRGYVCSRWKSTGECAANWHPAPDLEERVVRDLGALAPFARIDARRRNRIDGEIRETEAALRRNEARRRNVFDAIADRLYAGDQARQAAQDVEDERVRLTAQQERLSAELEALEAASEAESERPGRVRRIVDESLPMTERKAALQSVVRRIVVYPGDAEPYVLE